MPTSPNSLMTTAVSAKAGSRRSRLRRVVLPEPRKPVSTVTGIRILFSGKARPPALDDHGTDDGGQDEQPAQELAERQRLAEHARGQHDRSHRLGAEDEAEGGRGSQPCGIKMEGEGDDEEAAGRGD